MSTYAVLAETEELAIEMTRDRFEDILNPTRDNVGLSTWLAKESSSPIVQTGFYYSEATDEEKATRERLLEKRRAKKGQTSS